MNRISSKSQKLYPLSFPQRRLWFLDQYDPDNLAYNVSSLFALNGYLNWETLLEAFSILVSRHEVLRTTFQIVNGKPKQCVSDKCDFSSHFFDYSEMPIEERQKKLHSQAKDVSQQKYDLAIGPLLRVSIFKINDQEHYLQIAMHHIITDGWSGRIMIKELGTLYSCLIEGQKPLLPALPKQYGEIAESQQNWLQSVASKRQNIFWKEKLKGLQTLDLPVDKPRPTRQTFKGASIDWIAPKSLTKELKDLASHNRGTPFMVILAAFQILLARYSQQDDIVVGIPVANRNHSDMESVIGLFVNTLAIRTNLPQNLTFETLFKSIREDLINSYSNQEFPFEKLVEELQPVRDQSRNPIFQVFLAFQNLPNLRDTFTGIRIKRIQPERSTIMTDLDLYVWEDAGSLCFSVVYNVDLFKRGSFKRLIDRYQKILEAVVSDQSCRIWEIPLLSRKEQERMLVEWNSLKGQYANRTISELFEDQVTKNPDSIALQIDDRKLTFGDLNRQSNRLARHLRSLGVTTESTVGVYLGRSFEQIVAILAILKAGGTYVPLDPEYPSQRIHYMLRDSGATILISETDLGKELQTFTGVFIYLGQDVDPFQKKSDNNLDSITALSNAAYIIYTSGSTGNPKGVIGLHRGAINRFEWMWRAYPFNKTEVCCLKTRISFVDSVWEIFGPLLKGIRVVLIPGESVQDLEQLISSLSINRVTRITLVPSHLRAILNFSPNLAEELPDLRLWATSGETLPNELFREFRKKLPNRILLNLYGSSEVSADVTACELTKNQNREQVSIGKPITNTKIYILDDKRQPVPTGLPGEIYVAGDNLARGYINHPDLTKDRFVNNPFSKDSESRLFKTGDRARFWQNGEIEYLGRNDSQVKLRGYRIELHEVERALRDIEGIESTAVILKRNKNGHHYLAAFYQLVQDAVSAPVDFQVSLRQKLPDYMIPSVFTQVEIIPLNPNGKIDRLALTDANLEILSSKRASKSAFKEKTSTEIEENMIQVWKDVLHKTHIGPSDNFFDLGGHSLLAVELILKIEEVFGVRLPIRILFDASTASELTEKIEPQVISVNHAALNKNDSAKSTIHTQPSFQNSSTELKTDETKHQTHINEPTKDTPVRDVPNTNIPYRNLIQFIERMVETWEEVLQVNGIKDSDNFFDLGGHSLIAVDLVWKIDQVFGIHLPIRAVFDMPTARELALSVKTEMSNATYFTLSPVNENSSAPPLFLVQGLFLYRELAECLGSTQKTYGIYIEEEVDQQRKRSESQETLPFASVEKLAASYLTRILRIQPEGPYQLAGESFGGVVAFEIAQQLIKRGEEVAFVALFDTNAPGSLNTTYSRRLLNHFNGIVHVGVPYIKKLVKSRVERLKKNMKRHRSTQGHARMDVYRRYRPSKFPGQLILFRAMENEWIGHERKKDLGWNSYAKDGVVVHHVPGNHLGILRKPHVLVLAQKLQKHLIKEH